MNNVITVEAIDKKMKAFEAEFEKGKKILAKLQESKNSIDAQINSSLSQVQRLQGAWQSLSDLKAEVTCTEPEKLPEGKVPIIEPQKKEDVIQKND